MPNPAIIVIDDARTDTGWLTAIIEGRWCQAKVYDEPSCYGINFGRVSKLSIGKTAVRRTGEHFFNQMDYHYDRGLDFDTLPPGLLDKIVMELEALPKVFSEGE